MKEKKKHSVIWTAVLSLLAIGLCFFAGIFLDSALFVGEDGVHGHGMPIFTIVLPSLAVLVTMIRIIIFLVKKAVQNVKDIKELSEEQSTTHRLNP